MNLSPLPVIVTLMSAKLDGGNSRFDPALLVYLLWAFILLFIIVTILYIPRIYRRLLSKDGNEKNLKSFLLNDPATRDLLLKKKGAVPTRPAPGKTPPKPPPPAPAPPATPAPGPHPPGQTETPSESMVFDPFAPPPKPRREK